MKNIFFKTIFNKGAKGEKGDQGVNYEIPTNSIVAYDGVTIPEGYIETGAPISGGGDPTLMKYLVHGRCAIDNARVMKYLVHGRCAIDNAATDTNKPLTLTTYDGYSDFLTYDTTNNYFVVLQDFDAIIVPWVRCYQEAGSGPQMGLVINGNYVIRQIRADNTYNAVGGIRRAYTEEFSSDNPPLSFNGLHMKLNQGDTISLRKYLDTGWSDFNIKIYKAWFTSPSVENFLNSVYDLSDDNTYTEVELIGG